MLLVEIVVRQLSLRADIHFVRAEKYPRAVFFYALVAECRDHIYRLSRVLGRKRLERIQTLAVFRKSDRNDRHAVHRRMHGRKILHGLHERLAVVKSGTADDLAVHDDAAAGKAAHYINAFARVFIAQKPHPKLWVGRVNGDVHRAYVQVDYALNLALGQICQRNVVSQQKAQARVIVLEVHRLAHALRKLVDEAENAVVGAASGIIHQILGKLKAEVTPLGLFDTHDMLCSVLAAKLNMQHRLIREVFIVENIVDHVSVYADYLIAYMRLVQQRTVVIDF